MHVVLCQPDIAWEDKPTTFAGIRALLAGKPVPPGSLVILPEMAATGFSMNIAATAESPGGLTEQFLASLARTHHACVLGGLVAQWQGAPRNQAVAVAPDGTVLARYSKQQPFTPAGEATTYPAGHETVVFDWGGFRIAPFICYDLRFPELFRRATAAGATFFAVIANWPSPRHHHWRALLAARAIENLAATAGVNRAGQDPSHTYAGGSVALDAQGRMLAEAGERACTLTSELDPGDVAAWRNAFPALRDAGLGDPPTPGAG
jgi:predicted amidohydrolase